MKSLKLMTLAVVAMTASFANAGMNMSDVKPASVSSEVGSLGYGARLAWDVNNKTELQVGFNAGDVAGMIPCKCDDKTRKIDDIKFDIHSHFKNPYVGVQVRPMDNALTVGAGVMHIGNDKLHFESRTKSTDRRVTVGKDNKTYTVKGGAKVEGTVKFKNKLAPYLTFGVHPKSNKPVSMFAEVGAVYVGGLKTDVTTKGKFATADGSEIKTNDPMYADKVAQMEDDINQEIKERVDNNINGKDKVYPIMKVGVTARF